MYDARWSVQVSWQELLDARVEKLGIGMSNWRKIGKADWSSGLRYTDDEVEASLLVKCVLLSQFKNLKCSLYLYLGLLIPRMTWAIKKSVSGPSLFITLP